MVYSPKTLFIATRPWSFPVSIAPVLLTTLFVWQQTAATWQTAAVAVWVVISTMLFHAASNLWSDYFDYRKGVDTDPSVGSPTITGGLMTAHDTLVYATILIIIAVLNGLALMLVTQCLPLLVFGALGVLLSVCYPWLKFHALGDLDIFLTFGVLPTLGTAYVLLGSLSWFSLWITPAFITITVAVLHSNNTRDTERDGKARIHTLAMLIGPRISRWKYYFEVWLPLGWVVLCVILGVMPWYVILASALASVFALRNTRTMAVSAHGGSIDTLDVQTAQHQLFNVICLSIALIIHILCS